MSLPLPPQLVESLSKFIEKVVEQKLAGLSGAQTEALYRSRGGLLPPGCKTARGMRDRLVRYSVPHWLEGSGTRAVYCCRCIDYHAALRRPAKVKALAPSKPADDQAIALRAIEASGVRLTKAATR